MTPASPDRSQPNRQAREAALQMLSETAGEATALIPYHSGNALLIIAGQTDMSVMISQLAEQFTLTVLLPPTEQWPEWTRHPPPECIVVSGGVAALSGYLGHFEALAVLKEGKAINLASYRRPASSCFDLVLDLQTPPAIASALPPFGYFAPGDDPERLKHALEQLPDMRGEFEKPKYFHYNPNICAHGNSGLTACTRCIDACPADAITALVDKISVDPFLCQGGGICTTVCPSGALTYAYPSLRDSVNRLRRLLKTYHEVGGRDACLLIHDGEAGRETLSAMACELPDRVLPYPVEEAGSLGMDAWLSALAFGAREVVILTTPGTPPAVIAGIDEQLECARILLSGLGFNSQALRRAESVDLPHHVQTLHAVAAIPIPCATYMGVNDKRTVIGYALDHLYLHAPTPQTLSAMPAGAPFGEIQVDRAGCTMCMACVSVCPASALADGGDKPELNFLEDNCIQCGLCAQACPEQVIALNPRFLYDPEQRRQRRTLNEEAPFHCIVCGEAFATQSMISTISARLTGHSMFDEVQLRRLQMCGDCRVRDMFSAEREATW